MKNARKIKRFLWDATQEMKPAKRDHILHEPSETQLHKSDRENVIAIVEENGEIVAVVDVGEFVACEDDKEKIGVVEPTACDIGSVLYAFAGNAHVAYTDRYNVRSEEVSLDGVKHYLYRAVRKGRDIRALEKKIDEGIAISNNVIQYYTRSILADIQKMYKWIQ